MESKKIKTDKNPLVFTVPCPNDKNKRYLFSVAIRPVKNTMSLKFHIMVLGE